MPNLHRPLFIIGSPRSGTSLLRLILTSHSQILVPPECGFVIWLAKKYGGWQLADSKDKAKVDLFLDDLLACKKFDTWQVGREIVETQISRFQPANYAGLCEMVYRAYGASTGKQFTLWGDKNNFYLDHLDELLGIFKSARFLHIARDGRDVACSYLEVMADNSDSPYAPKLKTNIDDIALEWSSNVMKINSFMAAMPETAAMTLRYEDLVSTPTETVPAICAWLGLPFEEGMLNFHSKNKTDKLEPDLTMDWKKRTVEPISNATVGRYQDLLTTGQQSVFLGTARSALQLFSYV